MGSATPPAARLAALRRTYDAPYFHGANSGYPPEGYARSHPDWREWLERLRTLAAPGARWLDLGCAYGFLVAEARQHGFHAFGSDISRFALMQEEGLRGWLVEADALRLPFLSGAFDVITAFDLLEHLESPEETLREIARCLTPEGVVVAATPDPCRFERHEATHISERPPSHWVALLEECGLRTDYGFQGAPSNLVMAASRSQGRVRHFHQSLSDAGLLRAASSPDGLLAARLRDGFHRTQEGWVLGTSNEIYLLNRSAEPARVSVHLEAATTGHNGALLTLVDGQVMDRTEFFADRMDLGCSAPTLYISSGGHALRFEAAEGSDAGQVRAGSLRLDAFACTPEELTCRLPFDLYERYRAAFLIFREAGGGPSWEVLDCGGYMGDRGGHLADLADFGLPGVFTDLRPADTLRYVPRTALQGRSFDMVLALDVMEHVPAGQRAAFLDELERLSRRFILVGGPFADPEPAAAEQRIREWLPAAGISSHAFLAEHQALGLPPRDAVQQWAAERGYSCIEFQGMSARMWETLQKASLFLSHYQQYPTLHRMNALLNRAALWSAGDAPYRRFFLVCRHPPGRPLQLPAPLPEPAELLAFLDQQPEILSPATVRRRSGALFLLNEDLRHIRLLQNHIDLLQNQAGLLQNHAANLERLLQQEREKPLVRIAWHRLRRRLTSLWR